MDKAIKIHKNMLFWLGADDLNLNSAIKGYQVWMNINKRARDNTKNPRVRKRLKLELQLFTKNIDELRYIRSMRFSNGKRKK